jgi:hypothetical protein
LRATEVLRERPDGAAVTERREQQQRVSARVPVIGVRDDLLERGGRVVPEAPERVDERLGDEAGAVELAREEWNRDAVGRRGDLADDLRRVGVVGAIAVLRD